MKTLWKLLRKWETLKKKKIVSKCKTIIAPKSVQLHSGVSHRENWKGSNQLLTRLGWRFLDCGSKPSINIWASTKCYNIQQQLIQDLICLVSNIISGCNVSSLTTDSQINCYDPISRISFVTFWLVFRSKPGKFCIFGVELNWVPSNHQSPKDGSVCCLSS